MTSASTPIPDSAQASHMLDHTFTPGKVLQSVWDSYFIFFYRDECVMRLRSRWVTVSQQDYEEFEQTISTAQTNLSSTPTTRNADLSHRALMILTVTHDLVLARLLKKLMHRHGRKKRKVDIVEAFKDSVWYIEHIFEKCK